jgi:hypothetical protein
VKVAAIDWPASLCACGYVTLRLGAVQLEFTRPQVAELHRLIGEAMNELDIAPSDRPLVRVETTRH